MFLSPSSKHAMFLPPSSKYSVVLMLCTLCRNGAASLALLLTTRQELSACKRAVATATALSGPRSATGSAQAVATMGETGLMCAALLVYAAALLPQLQVLEITHMPLGVSSLVKYALLQYSAEAGRLGLSSTAKVLLHRCPWYQVTTFCCLSRCFLSYPLQEDSLINATSLCLAEVSRTSHRCNTWALSLQQAGRVTTLHPSSLALRRCLVRTVFFIDLS
jgi:hypothetical protein